MPPFGDLFIETHSQAPFNIPACVATNDAEGIDEEDEDEEDDGQSESNWSETGSQWSTSATTVSDDTASTTSEYHDVGWAWDPTLKIGSLEDLRGDFGSELVDPSAWILQRIIRLTEAGSEFAAREVLRHWFNIVALLTGTPTGGPLRLPQVIQPGDHRPATWEEADLLDGEARESLFGREVNDMYKRGARLSILFLFPDARTKGLSAGDKKRIFTVATNVLAFDKPKAEGLLWVMDKEYTHTREEVGREWANSWSKDFMVYTVLYPPPIVVLR